MPFGWQALQGNLSTGRQFRDILSSSPPQVRAAARLARPQSQHVRSRLPQLLPCQRGALAILLLFSWFPASGAQSYTTVHFWLSTVDSGPETPTLFVLPSASGEISVWGRPAFGYRLDAFSLDLVADTTGVIQFDSVTVNNPQLQATPLLLRHQVVFDSGSGLFPAANSITDFLGFSFLDGGVGLSNGAGIGPLCGLDPDCSTDSGADTWQLATATFTAGPSFGSTELYLQIGEHGLWQSPDDAVALDDPTDTSAVFGLLGDTVNHWSVPSVGGTDHRHAHQGAADAVIVIADADFDESGRVDGADLLAWQAGYGTGTSHADGDADDDGDVDGTDRLAWRQQYGLLAAAMPMGANVPEPSGLAAIALGIAIGGAGGVRARNMAWR